ncbi:serine O-acetyltransferase [bacterium A37T11]|nr:serine O-acetyltransferase [bacterium A37T11]
MLLDFVKSDLFRYSGNLSFKSFIKHFFITPGFKYMFYFRLCKHMKSRSKIIYYLIRLILRHYSFRYGFDIPVGTEIGYGFYIGHFGGIVISGKAKIGNNVNISQGVTIGFSARGKNVGYPEIGDNVFIGPGAKVMGGILVGDNACVGANAVVLIDCPNNSVHGGIPSKILSMNGSGGYILNKWIL